MTIYYVLVFLFGLLSGSFLNVCIYRIPEGKSIAYPPSHCTNCSTRLKALDLIPVFSFLFLRGRCRYCGTRISARYPFVELLTAIVFTVLFHRYLFSVEFFAFLFLMALLIAVFFIDIDHRIIPDELVIAGLAGGAAVILYNFFKPFGIYGDRQWWNPLLGSITGSGILFLVAVIGLIIYKSDDAMGMGDVKLFAPIGIFLGWKMCLLALFLSILAGGLSSLVLILLNKKKRKDTIPFGPFIVAGTLATILWGWDILYWYINRL